MRLVSSVVLGAVLGVIVYVILGIIVVMNAILPLWVAGVAALVFAIAAFIIDILTSDDEKADSKRGPRGTFPWDE